MVNNMKKVSKGAKRRLFFAMSFFVFLFIYTCYFTFNYWKQILSNKNEQKLLEKKYEELLVAEEVLETDVVKLQDPEYVAKYAREKYLYSKDGELIIKIIDEND